MRKVKNMDRYLVSYAGNGQNRWVWGKPKPSNAVGSRMTYADTMTLQDAERFAKNGLASVGRQSVVYRLVPVKRLTVQEKRRKS